MAMEMEINNTSQELWRNEYDRQLSEEMLCDLVKRATALNRRYAPRWSTDTAQDRINAAIVKLLDGARIWDPSRVDLSGFLLGVITSDLTSERRRSKMVPQVSLDEKCNREDDYTGETCDDAIAGSTENGWPVPLAAESTDAAWTLAMDHLRKRAGNDDKVLALIGAWEEGVHQKRDVMKLLNWSASTYKRVYRRLLELAEALDDDVRESIAHALTN
jgi:hypothetical protein